MKKIIILITIIAPIFSSCGIYKSYTRPDVEVENLFGDNFEETDTATIANLSWEEVFTDTHLQELIYKGLESNLDLEIAKSRIEQAETKLLYAKLSYLPSLSLDMQGSISSYNGSKATKTYQLPANASWELDLFGKQTNIKRQKEAALEQSNLYRQAVQTQLIANIANSYYTLVMLDREWEIC